MSGQAIFVSIILAFLLIALIKEVMRPGLILLTGAVIFMAGGILNGKEMLEGFSNKGMITVAMLFLVSEGVRQSGVLEEMLSRILPQKKVSTRSVLLRMMPSISFMSAFLNNTPVVVIFAPMLKRWAERMHLSASKLLIPLSYATILGGMCTLIGTSTNVVVHGMALEESTRNSAVRGLTMFELGQVGLVVALLGTLYLVTIGVRLLPNDNDNVSANEDENSEEGKDKNGYFRVDVVLAARFPAIGKRLSNYNFAEKYGAQLMELRRGGERYIIHDMRGLTFREGDTLVLMANEAFLENWADSSFFLMVSDSRVEQPKKMGKKLRWFTVLLLGLMVVGAAIGELPASREWAKMHTHGMQFDMFFFVCIAAVIMAWMNIFPTRKYTKFISWDILITIASAFAISKAMQNSGMADAVAGWAVDLAHGQSAYVMLALVFIICNVFTELMTNNAAAALSFPIALSLAEHLGVSPMPFIVTICIAASCSFCTPIGYQTNLIVQGIGGYRFGDFFKVGLPLNLIALIVSVLLVPVFWPF